MGGGLLVWEIFAGAICGRHGWLGPVEATVAMPVPEACFESKGT